MMTSSLENFDSEALVDPLTYLTYSETIRYRAGQEIYVEGEASRGMFLVLHGNVILTRQTCDHPGLLAIYQGGDFFGEVCLLSDFTNRETALALDQTTVMAWTPQHIQKMCDDSPRLALSLMQRQVVRSMDLVRQIERHSETAECRLTDTLLRFCECIGQEDGDGWVRLRTLSHAMLAGCTGLPRERVKTELNSLVNRRCLSLSWGEMRVNVADLAKFIQPTPEQGESGQPPKRFKRASGS